MWWIIVLSSSGSSSIDQSQIKRRPDIILYSKFKSITYQLLCHLALQPIIWPLQLICSPYLILMHQPTVRHHMEVQAHLQKNLSTLANSSITCNLSKECIFCSLLTSFGLAPTIFPISINCCFSNCRYYCILLAMIFKEDDLLLLLLLLCLLPLLCRLIYRCCKMEWLVPKYYPLGWGRRVRVLSQWALLQFPPRITRSSSRYFNWRFCKGNSPTEWNRLLPHDCLGMLRLEPLCLPSVSNFRGILLVTFGGVRGLIGEPLRFLRGMGVRDFCWCRRCMG